MDVALIWLRSTRFGAKVPSSFLPIATQTKPPAGTILLNVGFGQNNDGSEGFRRAKQVKLSHFAELEVPGGISFPKGLTVVTRGPQGDIGCGGDSGSPLLVDQHGHPEIIGVYSASESDNARHDPEHMDCKHGITTGEYISASAFGAWVLREIHPHPSSTRTLEVFRE
jgi:hypothetical protein